MRLRCVHKSLFWGTCYRYQLYNAAVANSWDKVLKYLNLLSSPVAHLELYKEESGKEHQEHFLSIQLTIRLSVLLESTKMLFVAV